MKLKKASAALGLLSILCMLLHMAFSVYCYLAGYYHPLLKNIFAYPFMVLVLLHAVLGMTSVFLHKEGTKVEPYAKQNFSFVLQRFSAALILPLLFLHINTFSLMLSSAQAGQKGLVILLMLGQLLFYAVVLTHIATSLTKGLVTLGLLQSEKTKEKLDKVIYVLGAFAFAFASFAVIRGQIGMFLG